MHRYELVHNGGSHIALDRNVIIGRSALQGQWIYHDRTMPEDFAELMLITIRDSELLSRNHAAIRKEGEGYEVEDLESRNGTYLDSQRLERGVRRPLVAGSVLQMGSEMFVVIEKKPTEPSAALPPTPGSPESPEWYLGAAGFDMREAARTCFYTSVRRVATVLGSRRYQLEVHGIEPSDIPENHSRVFDIVRKASVLEALAKRGMASDQEMHTVFQYTGHGCPEGLEVNPGELIAPAELFEAAGGIRGKKLFVIDACHAGVFLSDKRRIPPQTTVLAATRSADDVAYFEGLRAAGGDKPMTYLSRRLWELLKSKEGAFDIESERIGLQAAFHVPLDGAVYVQEPGMNSGTYSICINSVEIPGPGLA